MPQSIPTPIGIDRGDGTAMARRWHGDGTAMARRWHGGAAVDATLAVAYSGATSSSRAIDD